MARIGLGALFKAILHTQPGEAQPPQAFRKGKRLVTIMPAYTPAPDHSRMNEAYRVGYEDGTHEHLSGSTEVTIK